MKNKKLVSLSVASVLAVGAIASTLAWFTSTDKVTNTFEILKEDSEYINKDVEIQKTFNEDNMVNVMPGSNIRSTFSIKNISNYDMLVRAKFDKVWKYNDEVVTHYKIETDTLKDTEGNDVQKERVVYLNSDNAKGVEGATSLDLSFIELNFGNNLVISNYTSNKWAERDNEDGSETWYYYNGVLKGNSSEELMKTKALLDSVNISKNVTNVYKNLTFDIDITAESIQASNGAISEMWPEAPEKIKELGR